MPGEGLPATKLDDARAALYQALRRVWVTLGWPAERASERPPAQLVVPCAFVDVPVLHQSPTAAARGISATFPVVFVTDGSQESQVLLQDRLLAYAWQELDAVKLGQHRVLLQSGGPENVETSGGAMMRGLVFRVQVPLQVQTLCPQPLVQTAEEGTL